MFKSPQELFDATAQIEASLGACGHAVEACTLKDGLGQLNGLTDGWMDFLKAIEDVERRAAAALNDGDRQLLVRIHDAAYEAAYHRKRSQWWKFW